jgi:hypothetical protein
VKRLLRILFSAPTVVSALLWVATAVLWVRGFWFDEHLIANTNAPVCALPASAHHEAWR